MLRCSIKESYADPPPRLKKHQKQRLHKDGLPVAGTGDGRMRMTRMSNVLEAPGGQRRINRLSVAKVD